MRGIGRLRSEASRVLAAVANGLVAYLPRRSLETPSASCNRLFGVCAFPPGVVLGEAEVLADDGQAAPAAGAHNGGDVPALREEVLRGSDAQGVA